MKRKLASVQQVREIKPIEGADKIELAVVLGWQCVVKKGEFQVGDQGVFFEVDSVPPRLLPFEFLWTGKPDPDKVRITTIRLRGQLSQGLMMPMPVIASIVGGGFDSDAMEIGDDLTDLIGVDKYEKIVSAGARGPMPSFMPQTDEMRLQSFPAVLDEIRGQPYVITEKIDGTSATFLIDPTDGSFHACGRTESVKDTINEPVTIKDDGTIVMPRDNAYWLVARKYGIPKALAAHPDLAIQGEIYGPGIQKNRLEVKEIGFAAFNVYRIPEAHYLSHDEAAAILAELNVPKVPLVERGDSFGYTQDELLAKAEGKYAGTKNEREGIVIRPAREQRSTVLGDRLSFKVISNRFLLKNDE